MHYCLFGSCWLNADVPNSSFWGAPCTGDFWTLSKAGFGQNYWYVKLATALVAGIIISLYLGLVIHLTRLILFFLNQKGKLAKVFNNYYLPIIAINWLVLFFLGLTCFCLIVHNCITASTDYYCQATYCFETQFVCTYAILQKNSDYFSSSGLTINQVWTGWSLNFGWVAIFLFLITGSIYIVLRMNYNRNVSGKNPFWVESNKILTREVEKTVEQLYEEEEASQPKKIVAAVDEDKVKKEAEKRLEREKTFVSNMPFITA